MRACSSRQAGPRLEASDRSFPIQQRYIPVLSTFAFSPNFSSPSLRPDSQLPALSVTSRLYNVHAPGASHRTPRGFQQKPTERTGFSDAARHHSLLYSLQFCLRETHTGFSMVRTMCIAISQAVVGKIKLQGEGVAASGGSRWSAFDDFDCPSSLMCHSQRQRYIELSSTLVSSRAYNRPR